MQLLVVLILVDSLQGNLNDSIDDFGCAFAYRKLQIINHIFQSLVISAGLLRTCCARRFIIGPVKAYVYVTLKRTVLDPQGQTIHGALKKMQYKGVEDVRQGKYFVLNLDGTLGGDAAKTEVERIAREVLTNPVIEEFTYKLEE